MDSYQAELRKMKSQIDKDDSVYYQLRMKDAENEILAPLNPYLGKKIKIKYQDQIKCVGCGRKTNKSFNQGYCFPCLQKLAECDTCIIKPELCHFDQGTCRDNDFANSHCNIPHSIYLSLTSGMKIGVTRQVQEQTRWVDQGAISAIRVMTLKRRYHAGLIEAELAKKMPDKTNWRRMLKNEVEEHDLIQAKNTTIQKIKELIKSNFIEEDLSYILEKPILNEDTQAKTIKYPVLEYPHKITSFNLDKDPIAEGSLMGIKGQYLIMDTGVINLRKYSGYLVSIDLG